MSSMYDDRSAFAEAMARAEEAAGITRDADGNEVYAEVETPVATPELGGAVPVPASDQPLTPEPVVEETPDTPEQQQQEATPEEPAAPKTVEELQTALAVAEARIVEKENMVGRQSAEVGEVRQQMAELKTQLEAMQAQPVQKSVLESTPVTPELVESDPAFAVQAAFAQGDESALQYAFEAWKEVDPFTSSTWLADKKLERQQKEFDAKFAEQQAKIDEATAPLAETAAQTANQKEWALAFDEVKATRPDFIENAARLLEEVAPQYPSFLPALQNGDAKAKAEALSALYALDKMGDPQAVQAQLKTAAEEAAAEATAALRAAGAVTGQTTVGQGTELKTEEELEQEAYATRRQSKPSLTRGWTGRG